MDSGRSLARTTLKVSYGEDLQMFIPLTIRHILATLSALEHSANTVDLLKRVKASTGGVFPGLRSFTGERYLTQICVANDD
jgi:hypothetical protein